jgi:hypothetical protein
MRKEYFVIQWTDLPDHLRGYIADNPGFSNDCFVNYTDEDFYPPWDTNYNKESWDMHIYLKEHGSSRNDNILIECCW